MRHSPAKWFVKEHNNCLQGQQAHTFQSHAWTEDTPFPKCSSRVVGDNCVCISILIGSSFLWPMFVLNCRHLCKMVSFRDMLLSTMVEIIASKLSFTCETCHGHHCHLINAKRLVFTSICDECQTKAPSCSTFSPPFLGQTHVQRKMCFLTVEKSQTSFFL